MLERVRQLTTKLVLTLNSHLVNTDGCTDKIVGLILIKLPQTHPQFHPQFTHKMMKKYDSL
ncbi:hypothetical protein EX87_14550 [Brevibacillus laterosporus]|uniref:Uncharacterized protein n=1 Tax=Brevibacillus laterosporus TaxID=1465 RepID=A0A0F7C098_BRELA|nr:hypothetical protein EX87_14550 [Brevibacillus laterosporus]